LGSCSIGASAPPPSYPFVRVGVVLPACERGDVLVGVAWEGRSPRKARSYRTRDVCAVDVVVETDTTARAVVTVFRSSEPKAVKPKVVP